MKSFVTSYSRLFAHTSEEAPAVERIEIPLIQRDYAQGRLGRAVGRIRDSFLGVLHDAVTGGAPISLDFVYGDVDEGTLRPLDGQQRLTTLFLLHWYLAHRADRLDEEQGWKRFTYATRPSARLFCERLVTCSPPPDVERLSAWIVDQPWYLYTWRHDPTIQSMLVMLDAIHALFSEEDCAAAWDRLVSEASPAISFHLLPIEEKMGLSEDLYIKMNSRGKPLTPFENFKARFEQLLEKSVPHRAEDFAKRVDGVWSDLLWLYHGGDHIVDQEFMAYLHFVTEVAEWRAGRQPAEDEDAALAELVYGPSREDAAKQLDFLFAALDTWVEADIAAYFTSLFKNTADSKATTDTTRVTIFGQKSDLDINLFRTCTASYGQRIGRRRVFSLPHTLLLYAALLHRLHETPGISRRIRVVRNLVEATGGDIRLDRMPALIADVHRIVVGGSLDDVSAFNRAQVAEERAKADLCARHPEVEQPLFMLEDHPILRGSLAAFDFDAPQFAQRAEAFLRVFDLSRDWYAITGALLATGDYSQPIGTRFFQLGSSKKHLVRWSSLLTGAGRAHIGGTRRVLERFLDEVGAATCPLSDALPLIQQQGIEQCEEVHALGWRYYLVKYPSMREGDSGRYSGMSGSMGYVGCMLRMERVSSWYRDPFLLAVLRESGQEHAVHDPWFTGWETEPRWMRLKKSGTEMQCVEGGFEFNPPANARHRAIFDRVCADHGIGEDLVLRVAQREREGRTVDTEDRVQLGAGFVRNLVTAGL
jgi:hypothetical protein